MWGGDSFVWYLYSLIYIQVIGLNEVNNQVQTLFVRNSRSLLSLQEHCLVGMKGEPQFLNRGLDADVLVAEVRATSHKPDEIYGIIERLSPGTRKLELFGRPHNAQPNW